MVMATDLTTNRHETIFKKHSEMEYLWQLLENDK
jgi:hypothetical protein